MSTSSSLDYDQFGDLELAHFDALKAAGILHRNISLMNLILALRYGPRSNHSRFMDKLHTEKRDTLCRKIDGLGRQGVLVDWGYTVPVPSLSDPVAAEDSEHQLTARNVEHVVSRPSPITESVGSSLSDPFIIATSPIKPTDFLDGSADCVPVVDIGSPNSAPRLKLVSKLRASDEIVLPMGADKPDDDSCHTLDANPLHHMVSLIRPSEVSFLTSETGHLVLDVC